jgi:hypothetical protein
MVKGLFLAIQMLIGPADVEKVSLYKINKCHILKKS